MNLIKNAIISFFAFATTRYMLPNYILNKEINIYNMLILSTCYASCAFLRQYLSTVYNKEVNNNKHE